MQIRLRRLFQVGGHPLEAACVGVALNIHHASHAAARQLRELGQQLALHVPPAAHEQSTDVAESFGRLLCHLPEKGQLFAIPVPAVPCCRLPPAARAGGDVRAQMRQLGHHLTPALLAGAVGGRLRSAENGLFTIDHHDAVGALAAEAQGLLHHGCVEALVARHRLSPQRLRRVHHLRQLIGAEDDGAVRKLLQRKVAPQRRSAGQRCFGPCAASARSSTALPLPRGPAPKKAPLTRSRPIR
mmetsp:Transcript_19704/g.55532  ORF Transcript_19704/g.55532 Transcript_19704/m.55532 type:complete len:242 (-) Transcript_19704:202-927(-)